MKVITLKLDSDGKKVDNYTLINGDSIYPDSMGGSHRHMYELSRELLKQGEKVIVITPQINEEPLFEIINDVIYYRYKKRKNKILGFIDFMWGPYKKYKKVKKMHNINLIHGHWSLTNFLIFLFERKNDIRKIYTFHGPAFEEYEYELQINKIIKKVFLSIIKYTENTVLYKADQIIVASRYMKNKVEEIYSLNENINIIPVPTDTIKFSPKYKSKSLAKKELELSDNLTILSIRRLQKRMGLENLLIAFKEVLKKENNVKLAIGGKGPYKEELINLANELGIGENVIFLGFIPEEILPLYYEASDIFVIPSIDLEGFGLVTTEAMSLGTEVIATPIGGNVEILKRFDPFYLTEGIEPKFIAEKIINIIDIKKGNFSYSDNCRSFVIENFSWEKNIKKILSSYRLKK